MKIISILTFLTITFIINTSSFGEDLFKSEYHDIKFTSDDIDNEKKTSISIIKKLTFTSILKKILTINEFNKIKRNINEDLINMFIKNIIIDSEKIIGNNYSSLVKVNFDKKLIINYLRENKIPYNEYYPEKFLIIVYENNTISENLFTNNNSYYSYLKKNDSNLNFYLIPNLDINDKYLLSIKDLKNRNIDKINNFVDKYSNQETVIIFSEKINGSFVYDIYLYSNETLYSLYTQSEKSKDLDSFFTNLKINILDKWKNLNKIQNANINLIECNVKYYNIFELKQIKKNLNNISIVSKLELNNISLKLNTYEISYYGNLSILKKLMDKSKINHLFENDNCILSLQ